MVGYDLADGKEKWTVHGMPAACCTTPVVADGNLVFAGWSPGEDMKLPPFADLLKEYDADKDGKLSKAEMEKNAMFASFFDNYDQDKDGFVTKEEWDGVLAYLAKTRNSAFVLKPGGSGDVQPATRPSGCGHGSAAQGRNTDRYFAHGLAGARRQRPHCRCLEDRARHHGAEARGRGARQASE